MFSSLRSDPRALGACLPTPRCATPCCAQGARRSSHLPRQHHHPVPARQETNDPRPPQDTAAEMAKGHMDEETRWMLFDMLGHRNEWCAAVVEAMPKQTPVCRLGARGAWLGAVAGGMQQRPRGLPRQTHTNAHAHTPPPRRRWVPGKIVDIRGRLAPAVRAPGASRDVMLLDIALDGYFRCVGLVTRGRGPAPVPAPQNAPLNQNLGSMRKLSPHADAPSPPPTRRAGRASSALTGGRSTATASWTWGPSCCATRRSRCARGRSGRGRGGGGAAASLKP